MSRELRLVRVRVWLVRRQQQRVRVIAERVGLRRLEAAARRRADRPVAIVHAGHLLQERQRLHRRVVRDRVVADRRQLAGDDLGARVGRADLRHRGAHEPAVDVRRDRRAVAPAAVAVPLRLQPALLVGLVPDQIAIDLVLVARRHGARERAVGLRRRHPARVALARLAARPHRPRARDREHHPHAGLAHHADGVVQVGPAVARIVVVCGVEPRGCAAGVAVGRDLPPARVDRTTSTPIARQALPRRGRDAGWRGSRPSSSIPISRSARAGAAAASAAAIARRRTSAASHLAATVA